MIWYTHNSKPLAQQDLNHVIQEHWNRVGRMGNCPPRFWRNRKEDRNWNGQSILFAHPEFSFFRHLWLPIYKTKHWVHSLYSIESILIWWFATKNMQIYFENMYYIPWTAVGLTKRSNPFHAGLRWFLRGWPLFPPFLHPWRPPRLPPPLPGLPSISNLYE